MTHSKQAALSGTIDIELNKPVDARFTDDDDDDHHHHYDDGDDANSLSQGGRETNTTVYNNCRGLSPSREADG
jgi:hypothetical protein